MALNRIRLFFNLKFGSNRNKKKAIISSLNTAMNSKLNQRLTTTERELVSEIRKETAIRNQNNLTRTHAYLEFYHLHPEVHWALLAHCVSRNGGYGMTDLKGELFLRMADLENSKRFFAFLERANWLIFHDAYAQMLLYQEGKKLNQNVSHLLPSLGVSKFMVPIWNDFFETQNSKLMTRALIINEQNYIESRVVQNPIYKSTVESSIQFQMESILNLNQVLMPYEDDSIVRLAGTTMLHFTSVTDRICTGIRLYHALFGVDYRHQAILQFLNQTPHSGSRADYWPDIFTYAKTTPLNTPYHPRLSPKNPELKKIYSPKLMDAWPDVTHEHAEPGDWFQNFEHAIFLFYEPAKHNFEITKKYRKNIQVIENLIMAKEKMRNILT